MFRSFLSAIGFMSTDEPNMLGNSSITITGCASGNLTYCQPNDRIRGTGDALQNIWDVKLISTIDNVSSWSCLIDSRPRFGFDCALPSPADAALDASFWIRIRGDSGVVNLNTTYLTYYKPVTPTLYDIQGCTETYPRSYTCSESAIITLNGVDLDVRNEQVSVKLGTLLQYECVKGDRAYNPTTAQCRLPHVDSLDRYRWLPLLLKAQSTFNLTRDYGLGYRIRLNEAAPPLQPQITDLTGNSCQRQNNLVGCTPGTSVTLTGTAFGNISDNTIVIMTIPVYNHSVVIRPNWVGNQSLLFVVPTLSTEYFNQDALFYVNVTAVGVVSAPFSFVFGDITKPVVTQRWPSPMLGGDTIHFYGRNLWGGIDWEYIDVYFGLYDCPAVHWSSTHLSCVLPPIKQEDYGTPLPVSIARQFAPRFPTYWYLVYGGIPSPANSTAARVHEVIGCPNNTCVSLSNMTLLGSNLNLSGTFVTIDDYDCDIVHMSSDMLQCQAPAVSVGDINRPLQLQITNRYVITPNAWTLSITNSSSPIDPPINPFNPDDHLGLSDAGALFIGVAIGWLISALVGMFVYSWKLYKVKKSARSRHVMTDETYRAVFLMEHMAPPRESVKP